MQVLISSYLPIIQVGLSVLLIIAILLQRTEADLGSAFGGGAANSPFRAKRGLERQLFIVTIILAILFTVSTVLAFLVF